MFNVSMHKGYIIPLWPIKLVENSTFEKNKTSEDGGCLTGSSQTVEGSIVLLLVFINPACYEHMINFNVGIRPLLQCGGIAALFRRICRKIWPLVVQY